MLQCINLWICNLINVQEGSCWCSFKVLLREMGNPVSELHRVNVKDVFRDCSGGVGSNICMLFIFLPQHEIKSDTSIKFSLTVRLVIRVAFIWNFLFKCFFPFLFLCFTFVFFRIVTQMSLLINQMSRLIVSFISQPVFVSKRHYGQTCTSQRTYLNIFFSSLTWILSSSLSFILILYQLLQWQSAYRTKHGHLHHWHSLFYSVV